MRELTEGVAKNLIKSDKPISLLLQRLCLTKLGVSTAFPTIQLVNISTNQLSEIYLIFEVFPSVWWLDISCNQVSIFWSLRLILRIISVISKNI